MFSKQYTPLKIIVYGLMMIVCYLMQSVPSLGVRFMDKAPELLLVLSICVAYRESETFSAFFGLAAGLLSDIITDGIVGKSALFFMFLCFFISVLLKTLIRNLFLTYIFTVLGSTLLFLLLEYIFSALFFGNIPFGISLLKIILPKFLFTGVLAYPIYYLVNLIGDKLFAGGDSLS